jgi:hypothetical protein
MDSQAIPQESLLSSIVETIDDLIAENRKSARWFTSWVCLLVALAVGFFIYLFAREFQKEALTLAGPGGLLAASVPLLIQVRSRMDRVGSLKTQKKRALRNRSSEGELRKIDDDIRDVLKKHNGG